MRLAVVETPFQLLCAYELVQKYNAEHIQVVVRFSGRGSNDQQLESMIAELEMKVEKVYFPAEFSLVKYLRCLVRLAVTLVNAKCNVMYQGSRFSRFQSLFSRFVRAKEKWYLDDGFATLMMSRWPKEKLSKLNLYTVFNLSSDAFGCVEINDFVSLSRKVAEFKVGGCYFIGQPLVERGYLEREAYLQMILDAKSRSSSLMYYIPHRVESDSLFDEISKIEGCAVLNLGSCVEWYFVQNRIYPERVFGINSTALVSLSSIFPEANVLSYKVGFRGYPDGEHIEMIYSYLSEMRSLRLDSKFFDGG